jgi:hypothetical protein
MIDFHGKETSDHFAGMDVNSAVRVLSAVTILLMLSDDKDGRYHQYRVGCNYLQMVFFSQRLCTMCSKVNPCMGYFCIYQAL